MENRSGPGPVAADERAAALRQVEHDFPYWRCWVGVLPHLLYARRVRSSPPRVVRAPDVAGLRQAIADNIAERGQQ